MRAARCSRMSGTPDRRDAQEERPPQALQAAEEELLDRSARRPGRPRSDTSTKERDDDEEQGPPRPGRSDVLPLPEARGAPRKPSSSTSGRSRARGTRASRCPTGGSGMPSCPSAPPGSPCRDEYPELGAVSPETLGGSSPAVVTYVEDVDALVAQAAAAGATIDRVPQDVSRSETAVGLAPRSRSAIAGPSRAGSRTYLPRSWQRRLLGDVAIRRRGAGEWRCRRGRLPGGGRSPRRIARASAWSSARGDPGEKSGRTQSGRGGRARGLRRFTSGSLLGCADLHAP